MSFSALATELIFEVVAHIDSDDTKTLLACALSSKQLFAIVVPKLITAQSNRLKTVMLHQGSVDDWKLTVLPQDSDKRLFMERDRITLANYWFHEDSGADNVFAQDYDTVAVASGKDFPQYPYAYICALLKRAARIRRVEVYIIYQYPSDCIWLAQIVNICALRNPAPTLQIHGGTEVSAELSDGPFINPILVRESRLDIEQMPKRKGLPQRIISKVLKSLVRGFPTISSRRIDRLLSINPPQTPIQLSYGCNIGPPIQSLSFAKPSHLERLVLCSETMFMPSIYPFMVQLINTVTELNLKSILLSQEAWSQTLYGLEIPALRKLVLQDLGIAVCDVLLFLHRHQSITQLDLLLAFIQHPRDRDQDILPTNFDLPFLSELTADLAYAALFIDYCGRGDSNLRQLHSVTAVNGSIGEHLSARSHFLLHDMLRATPDRLSLRIKFESCFCSGWKHFRQWAILRRTNVSLDSGPEVLLRVTEFRTYYMWYSDFPDATHEVMLQQVRRFCTNIQHLNLEALPRYCTVILFFLAFYPHLEHWYDDCIQGASQLLACFTPGSLDNFIGQIIGDDLTITSKIVLPPYLL